MGVSKFSSVSNCVSINRTMTSTGQIKMAPQWPRKIAPYWRRRRADEMPAPMSVTTKRFLKKLKVFKFKKFLFEKYFYVFFSKFILTLTKLRLL